MTSFVQVITRGDDAGSCSSANSAIAEAFRHGVLRNASVMVPGPALEEGARLLRGLDGLCLGLHVTLNAEWDAVKWGPVLPASRVPSLVDCDGHLHRTPDDTARAGARLDEMTAEVEAQLARAREHGLRIEYLDEHMGIGRVGGLREQLADICRREGLVDAHAFAALRWWDLPGNTVGERLVAAAGSAAPGAYVVVTHPGYDAPDMRAFRHAGLEDGQVARERDGDRRFWLDPILRAAVDGGEFAVTTYAAAARVRLLP